MKNQWIKTASVLLLAGVLAAGMDAQPRRGWDNGGYGRQRGYGDFQGYGPGRMALWSQLDLTDQQQDALKSLRLEHYKEIKPLRSKMIELKAKEQALLAEDEVDMKAVNSVIDEQSDLSNQIRKLRVEHQVQVRNILTEEQKMILDQSRAYRNFGRGRGFDCPYGYQRWGDGKGYRGNGPGMRGNRPRGWRALPQGWEDQPGGEDL
jgi:Spy/CpxP family protein refolding chaperone